MALIVCPECGGKLSDKAEYCPHCGCPSKYISTNAISDFVVDEIGRASCRERV